MEQTLMAGIKAEMGRQGLTVADVVARWGALEAPNRLSERQVRRRLSGAVAMTVDDVVGLAGALGVPLSTLMQPEESTPEV